MNRREIAKRWEESLSLISEASGSHIVAIMEDVGDGQLEVAAIHGDRGIEAGARSLRADSYCGHVLETREPLEVRDAATEGWESTRHARAGLIAYLGYPVRMPDGSVWGTLCLFDEERRGFSPALRRLVEHVRDLVESHLELEVYAAELRARNAELEESLRRVRRLEGLIPICASCKDVRDDRGYWTEVETYLQERSDTVFSHGICPSCEARLYPEIA